MRCPNCDAELKIFKNPIPTVDIIIELSGGIVLIERKNPPFGWALPGGFVDYGESYEDAALREAEEETGLKVTGLRQFHTYSHPSRDARMHTASTVFIGQAVGEPLAADDASQAKVFKEGALPNLVFDHAKIVADYFAKRAGRKE
ncbi:MAG: NUDIX hydrolase [Desulfobulbaceae bacterium]|nr:NUDIX hydrolase [Desulfobulbaceae bacterium]